MKILVDADACPVKSIIEEVAQDYRIPVLMIIDTSHELSSVYSEILQVGKAPDAVDVALFNHTSPGDIVVTGDYGVASMVLGKNAFAIDPNGRLYTNQNIDFLMYERHVAKKKRKNDVHTYSMKKRTREDDKLFRVAFIKLCKTALQRDAGMDHRI